MKQITATVKTGDDAKRAVETLVGSSFPSDDISVLRVEGNAVVDQPVGQKTGIPLALPIGIAIGAAVGAFLALTGVPQAIGLVSPETTVGVFKGLAVGSGAGLILGIFAGLARWKADARIAMKDPHHGGYLVGVPASDERAQEVRAALETQGVTGVSVAERRTDSTPR